MVSGAVATEIASIGGGGSGLTAIIAAAAGCVTTSEAVKELYFEHGLGVIPDVVYGYTDDVEFPTSNSEIVSFAYAPYPYRVGSNNVREKSFVLGYAANAHEGVGLYGAAETTSEINENAVRFVRGSSVYSFRPGRTYKWFAVKFAEV
jgi:hypothetical protein